MPPKRKVKNPLMQMPEQPGLARRAASSVAGVAKFYITELAKRLALYGIPAAVAVGIASAAYKKNPKDVIADFSKDVDDKYVIPFIQSRQKGEGIGGRVRRKPSAWQSFVKKHSPAVMRKHPNYTLGQKMKLLSKMYKA